jgi:uncharacterized membrane protein YkvA (DUF1232 family)
VDIPAWIPIGFGALLLLYGLAVVALLLAGRRTDARALAGFIPDCVVLIRRLLGDDEVARWRKGVLVLLLAYLVSPIDLVPDFVPGLGQLDDAIVVALALRVILRGGGPELLRRHWPGPASSRELVARIAYPSRAGSGRS